LIEILPSFVEYMKSNPKSYLNKFIGLHAITMYDLTLYFVVLENVFVPGEEPHEKYDIKGSWIDRHTNHHVESGKLMKDEDLHKTLLLNEDESEKIYKQLKEDSKFLSSHKIMDYSMLIGIYYVGINPKQIQTDIKYDNEINVVHDQPTVDNKEYTTEHEDSYDDDYKHEDHKPPAPGYEEGIKRVGNDPKAVMARVIEGPGIYYLGIIDMLQKWDLSKQVEYYVKILGRCKDSRGISCIKPSLYERRFLSKMRKIGIRPKDNRQ